MTNEATTIEESGSAAKIDQMGTEPMFKLIVKYSLPAIAGMLVMVLYNIVDGIFIGWGIGDAGIAATSVALPVMTIISAISSLIGGGASVVGSIRLGERRKAEAEGALGQSVTLTAIAAVLLLVICIPLMDPLLIVCGSTEESHELAKIYLTIILAGYFTAGISGGMSNFVRAAGAPNVAMLLMLQGAAINVVLDWLFVLVFSWGIAGAAVATVIAQASGTVLTLAFFMRKKSPINFRLRCLKLDAATTKSILLLGLASFFLNALMAISTAVLNQLYVYWGASYEGLGGTGALAAAGVVGRVSMLAFQIIIGVSMAAQPIIGYNFGAGLSDRVKQCFWQSCWAGFVGLLVFWAVLEIIPTPFLVLFNLSSTPLEFAEYGIRIYMILMPIAAFGVISSTYFTATGQAAKANFLVLLRQMILLVPMLCICPIVIPALFPSVAAVSAIFWAYPIVDIVSTAVSFIMAKADLKKIDEKMRRHQEELKAQTA